MEYGWQSGRGRSAGKDGGQVPSSAPEEKPQKFLELWMEELQVEDNEAVKKLAGMGVFYKTMAEFMSAVQLGIESDIKRCGNRDYASGAVTLMTLHGAKGLEFPVTFIYGAGRD